jgi:hypothetical protein
MFIYIYIYKYKRSILNEFCGKILIYFWKKKRNKNRKKVNILIKKNMYTYYILILSINDWDDDFLINNKIEFILIVMSNIQRRLILN